MKIYIIMCVDYHGDDWIYEIYSTRERAEGVVNKIQNGELEIECMCVNVIEREVKE